MEPGADFLQEKMAGLGLEVSVDKVGNVYGRLSGRDPQQKVILTGSHIDTVVNGGKYDGAYGIAAAMIALQDLQRNFGQPQRTLEVVSFVKKRGADFRLLIGVRAMSRKGMTEARPRPVWMQRA